ncbi:MAG TPA: hypothetical protein VJV78_22270 [Polyangiales bacterium]|nr:hypothetical protein [Polyangiales bacterium]
MDARDILHIVRTAFLYGLIGSCSVQQPSDATYGSSAGSSASVAVSGNAGSGNAGSGDASPMGAGSEAIAGMPDLGGAGGGAPMSLPQQRQTCLNPGSGSYGEPGPYQVTTEEVDLGRIDPAQQTGKFTIYAPSPLEDHCPHPIVAWGNGTAVSDADAVYGFLNRNAASWGIVVIASNDGNVGSGKFHEAALSYLLKANLDPKHEFYDKLSTRAGLSGHDTGGFGASVAASHPNVKAIVTEGANIKPNSAVPVLILTGTEDLFSNAMSQLASATAPIFVATWEGGTRTGTATMTGYSGQDSSTGNAAASQRGSLQFQRLYAAWFRCFLADDDVACALFSGGTPTSCGICRDPGWSSLASKNF